MRELYFFQPFIRDFHWLQCHVRSWLHVEDFCSAIDLAMHSAKYGSVYNVAGTCRQNKTIIKNICRLFGKNYRNCIQYIDDRPGGDFRYSPDCTKIQKELGWKPQVTIEKGIEKILKQIDYWREAPVWTPDSIADATKDWFKYLGK